MNKREKVSRDIWKSVEQREKEADWTWPGLSTREGRLARVGIEREDGK